MHIVLNQIGKRYKGEQIFTKCSFEFSSSNHYGIIGGNGSGKSTLLKVIAGITPPSEGKVTWKNPEPLETENWYQHLSFSSPYMDLPEQLSLVEVFEFQSKFHGFEQGLKPKTFLEITGLTGVLNKPIGSYSSGMKQRAKLALSICSKKPVIFLDEPCSNLDAKGMAWFQETLNNFASDKLVFVASNEMKDELFSCQQHLDIRNYKIIKQ